jgi:hypothetical protein
MPVAGVLLSTRPAYLIGFFEATDAYRAGRCLRTTAGAQDLLAFEGGIQDLSSVLRSARIEQPVVSDSGQSPSVRTNRIAAAMAATMEARDPRATIQNSQENAKSCSKDCAAQPAEKAVTHHVPAYRTGTLPVFTAVVPVLAATWRSAGSVTRISDP